MRGDPQASEESDSAKGLGLSVSNEETEIPVEQARTIKALKTRDTPTQEMIDLHRITHIPYRSWCPECVEGFAREWAHRQRESERLVPLISCDYLYITEKGISVEMN